MKNLTFINILILVALFACKTSQNVVKNMQTNNDQTIQINIPSTINSGQHLQVKILTNLDEGIVLFDPMLIRIERFENNEWKQLRILHCPCGANCEAPPREQFIHKGEIWSMSWNLIESWCENVKGQDIPNTIEVPAIPGKYRAVFNYGQNTQNKINVSKEFQIIN